MAIHDREEFIVFDVAQAASELDVPQESQEIEDLPKSGVRRQRPNLGQHGQRFFLKV
ncbi:MAG TPA: hypothetical protein VK137_03575 [Planctomycetaceae bacterium]|nr:hypothetical protein [Planctomycetaceae bacterium]